MRLSQIFLVALVLLGKAVGQSFTITPGGGVYSATETVSMQVPEGLTVRYTTNGNIPTSADKAYVHPLLLSNRLLSNSNIYRIQNCPDTNWQACENVDKIVVLRAALFDSAGIRHSEVKTEVYIVNSLIDRNIKLPIVSLCIDSTDLFDFDSGIFIPGSHFSPDNIFHSGNYCEKGIEWERNVNFTFIEGNAVVFNQDCGIRIHGNRSRSYMQKGFTLYARKEYGNKEFRYKFFGDDALGNCKRIVLRPWLASWSGAGVEDWLCQQLAKPLLCDNLETRPVVLFLNGEYWGIYFLEEKADEHYIEDHYGYDDDNVNILVNWGDEVDNGSGSDWYEFYEWLETADLRNDVHYQYVATKIDIEALLDYMLLQVYVANVDWPANNVRQWAVDGHPWRWIFFDGDAAFSNRKDETLMFQFITCDDESQTYPSSPHASLLFRRLLANDEFRIHSIDRFSKLVWHYLGNNHASPLLNEVVSEVKDEVVYQSERFGNPKSVSNWKTKIKSIRQFLNRRTEWVVHGYAEYIGEDIDNVKTTLYPNPSTTNATLCYENNYGGVVEVEVLDVMGRSIYKKTIDLEVGTNSISMPPLSKGIYTVRTSEPQQIIRWVVR